ncbi:MAG: HipA domain-containing protein, partial [Flavobacterium sp.]|nr:HipA domain-containing protein [Flavobacterium sp.]
MKNYKKKYFENLETNTFEVNESQTSYGNKCLYCYEFMHRGEKNFHEACNKRFFGQLTTPTLAYDLKDLQQLAAKIIQSQMVVTGVQAKISLSLHRKEDKNITKKLTIVGLYGDYILKPPSEYYPELPELESATMRMAEVCGIAVVPSSLVYLQDQTLCYITKRV